MTIIAFTTTRERNEKTGRIEDVVERAFSYPSGKTVVLPNETPQALGACWDDNSGLWMLDQDRPAIGARRHTADYPFPSHRRPACPTKISHP